MLSHYVKVSFRELLKYRTQSIVSIIGLAVGFTAFILGGYWLWWETHFDKICPEKVEEGLFAFHSMQVDCFVVLFQCKAEVVE
jgi:hypothetical protein